MGIFKNKNDDEEVLSPVAEEKEAVEKAPKKATKKKPKEEKVDDADAKAAEAERIRLRNLGYI